MSNEGFLVVSEGEDPVRADIIFIHGLRGNREGTLTKTKVKPKDGPKTDIFWPGALLAQETWMKHVRVMCWGYGSEIAKIGEFASQNSIFGHADNLLEDIAGKRYEQDELNRPIIFIGHSLGGLVIKQAIIRSNQIHLNKQDTRLGAIYPSTSGVIFLGTPHRGSDLAPMGDAIRRILRLAGQQPNDKLLKSLKVDSDVLEQQISAFSSVSKDMPLVCVYEDLPTLGLGLIVGQFSAVMDGFKVKNISVHANHEDICKFEGLNDIGYTRISQQIRNLLSDPVSAKSVNETASEQKDWCQMKQETKCLQILRGSRDYEGNKNRNPQRVRNTCQWILEDPQFIDWRDNKPSGLLWISAGPGFGKSVLARTLIDDRLLSQSEITTCYFFFREDDESARRATDALSALLHQLLVKHPALIKYALPYAKDGDFLSRLIHTLWGILLEIFNDPALPTLIFVVDALDESDDSGKVIIEKLVDFYNQYQTPNGSPTGTVPKVKFLVTSRPYGHIEKWFGNLAGGENIQLSGDGKAGALKKEIELYVETELSSIKNSLRLRNEVIRLLRDHLSAMENRNYLWLHLVFDVIRNSDGATTQRGMQKLIARLPETADGAYEAILRKSSDPKEAARLLHFVVAAVRPLTVRELRIASAIHENTQSKWELDLESVKNFELTIRNQCGLFITITDHTVYLVHNTAKEFLLSTHELPSNNSKVNGYTGWKHSINPLKSHELLSWACIRYLCFLEFDEDGNATQEWDHHATVRNAESDEESISNSLQACYLGADEPCNSLDSLTVYDPRHYDDMVLQLRYKEHQFLEYASMYWLSHFEMARPNDKILQQSLKLCDVHSELCANWFETLPVKEGRHLSFFKMSLGDKLVKRSQDLAFCSFIGHIRGVESFLQDMEVAYRREEARRTVEGANLGHVGNGILEAIEGAILKALYIAIEHARSEIVRILLLALGSSMVNMDLDYNTSAFFQQAGEMTELTPLRFAVRLGRHDLVPLLLELNANPNAAGQTTILADALRSPGSMKALTETVRLLLQYGAEVNDIRLSGSSPLYIALSLSLPDCVCHLLRKAGGKCLKSSLNDRFGILTGLDDDDGRFEDTKWPHKRR